MYKNEAFASSVVGMQGNLLSFALKLTADKDKAQDLVQDTTLKALRNEDKFVDETNLHGWLITIMRNIYINNCRRNAKVGQIADDDEDLFHIKLSRESEVDTPDGAIAVNEINAIVAGFPAEFRKPFSMHIAGYKYEEISELLKMPLGTVKGRIFSTRKRLREMLKDYR